MEAVTNKTYQDVEIYIDNAIDAAKSCNDMYKYQARLAAKFGRPF